MHLRSLTLKGFKSFASATTLSFEPGITCVVGPNGSGKSNVVDALAWVMGEQGAKSLRGGSMSDVIFAGTPGRPPLGRAEVALTIDNSDGSLPIDYTEVTISRTIFRNGGSEYAINGEACRLLDVQELLSDSGIGREMHVIVGQGQLDSILHATPEDRRGFIEEAAGVLKHRKRKEKALRKLEAMEGNLTRLTDLTSELRRQLKPLGRQAEVARRASVIQADARDARLRLLADDLATFRAALAAEIADETALRERRQEVESRLAALGAREAVAENEMVADAPVLGRAQETWFALSSLRERFLGTASLAAERLRLLGPEVEDAVGRDPDALDAEAREVRAEEFEWSRRVESDRASLADAVSARAEAEAGLAAEERRVAAAVRAEADRREGLARLAGQVAAARTRVETRESEVARLAQRRTEAVERAATAQREFTALETQVAGLDEGEVGLDADYEVLQGRLAGADARVEECRAAEREAERERTALTAREEALRMSLSHGDGTAALLAAGEPVSARGTVAEMLQIESGWERAIAAVLGPVADAVVVPDPARAIAALVLLAREQAGRAHLVVLGVGTAPTTDPGPVPASARWAIDAVGGPADLVAALAGSLDRVALVDDLEAARRVREARPDAVAVTREGDILAPGRAVGGSGGGPTLLEITAALEETTAALAEAQHRLERARFDLSRATDAQGEIAAEAEAALSRLHESDARLAAVAENLGQLGQAARSAQAEAERLAQAERDAGQALEADREALSGLQRRLDAAQEAPEGDVGDEREALAAAAEVARRHEVEARLAVRTGEERVQSLAGRAESLERAALTERATRRRVQERRERRVRELTVATAVSRGVEVVLPNLTDSLAGAEAERTRLEQAQAARETELHDIRGQMRDLAVELERLTDSVHRDEVARAEQRLRIEQVETRVIEEFGMEPDHLVAEYGPDQPVPPSPAAPGDEEGPRTGPTEPYPYDRAEQERRLKSAERGLALLGRVNPLALEEFTALEERLRFLTEQVDDIKRSRQDLLAIIRDVDARVEEVFAAAFADTAREFEGVFGRLFPGGDGRLVLTDPDNLLTTGIEVEARPPGKKVKRLSLLSGGERSLTAVAFLIALFKARPSPFYVLDEVEAALDDVNLGRLIDAIEELRDSSQLIIVTHQKRTMEIADALYGVSMRGDGVTQVVGQRIRDTESVPA